MQVIAQHTYTHTHAKCIRTSSLLMVLNMTVQSHLLINRVNDKVELDDFSNDTGKKLHRFVCACCQASAHKISYSKSGEPHNERYTVERDAYEEHSIKIQFVDSAFKYKGF